MMWMLSQRPSFSTCLEENTMIINNYAINEHDRKKLEPGDVIVCGGIRAEISRIIHQDWWIEEGFQIEFYDTNGKYRSWKQHIDGGRVIPKE